MLISVPLFRISVCVHFDCSLTYSFKRTALCANPPLTAFFSWNGRFEYALLYAVRVKFPSLFSQVR